MVVATNPEGEEGSLELLEEIQANLATFHPALAKDPNSADHPIVAASRLVQEDLCVLVREDTWRLRAACVCFPSRWDLATKIGTTLDDIHGPVPGYDDQLARPTTLFFDRLRPDRSFWRLNWTLLDSPDLFQPATARQAPEGELEEWYFRVERQTLRSLARTRAVVFTIRTYVTSAATLCERDDTFAATLVACARDGTPRCPGLQRLDGCGDAAARRPRVALRGGRRLRSRSHAQSIDERAEPREFEVGNDRRGEGEPEFLARRDDKGDEQDQF